MKINKTEHKHPISVIADTSFNSLAWTIGLRLEQVSYHCPVNRQDARLHRIATLYPDITVYRGVSGNMKMVALGKIWQEQTIDVTKLKHALAGYWAAAHSNNASVFLFVEKGLYPTAQTLARKIGTALSIFWFKSKPGREWELDPNLYHDL